VPAARGRNRRQRGAVTAAAARGRNQHQRAAAAGGGARGGGGRAWRRGIVVVLVSFSEGANISRGAGHGETCRIPVVAHFVVEQGGLR
jgi:hypothetical protein